ncbi:PucR family transcriptional regulator [Spirillospora sp. CA-128828]|uniref:PucR family transcriptional regulator n=1 Tax=Spirillospora sp. CA-128828 TaxID=3240033 RepID=UPI003D8C8D7C
MNDRSRTGHTQTAESLAGHLSRRVPALADALVRAIQEQNPGYQAVGVVSTDDLWRSCHDNIVRMLELISRPDRDSGGPGQAGYYDAARATGRRRAEQRMPLDTVLRSFRLGGRLLWEALIDQAREDGVVDSDGLLEAATRVWEAVDATSAQVAAAYHAAEGELLRADDRHRAMLWDGLLDGRARQPGFAHEAARIIGVPVEGRYAVVVADAGPGNERIGRRIERRLAADEIHSAWQISADGLIGLLVMGRAEPAVALRGLRETLVAPAGLSLVVAGLAGVEAAYRQALVARRTIAPETVEVAALEERLPEAILLGSPELAEQLVRLWLGPLITLPAAERRLLLSTLDTWVATGGSIKDTAELAHCHRNTVLNRLRRIHAITGHDFTDSAARLEVSLALRASRLPLPDPLM